MKLIPSFFRSRYLQKYGLVLLIFLFLLIFSSNTGGLKTISQFAHDQAVAQQADQDYVTPGTYFLGGERPSYLVQPENTELADTYYQLSFDLRTEKNPPLQDGFILPSATPGLSTPSFQIAIQSKDGSVTPVKQWNPLVSKGYQSIVETLKLTPEDRGVLLAKNNKTDYFQFALRNLHLRQLDIPDSTTMLRPVVAGNTSFDTVIKSNTSANLAPYFTFEHQNEVVGELFQANSDYLSALDLKLLNKGTGGTGKYRLEIHPVLQQGGQFIVQASVLAGLEFGVGEYGKYVVQTGRLEDKYVWHFPLATFLQKGNYYFIGLSNEGVDFNILNTLQLYGSTTSNPADQAVVWRNNQLNSIGQLYYRLYGATFQSNGQNTILTNALSQDLGGGKGLYTYQTKNWFSDVLDLDPAFMLTQQKNGSFYFDTIRHSLVASATNSMTMQYKIDTVYPFTQVYFTADQIPNTYPSQISYSLDQKEWTSIPRETLTAKSKHFDASIPGDGTHTLIYFRITYGQNTDSQNIPLFGLENLQIKADLKT